MTAPPDLAPDLSTTARLADKETTTGADAALMRRTVTALVSITNCRRSEARERINAWLSDGAALADLEAWLHATYRVDPTGVTAVRRVTRERGF